jgi:hypothetical protein
MPQPQVVPGRGWQFSLRQIFELTTLMAVASAVASAFGPGTLVASAGVIVAWLNLRGAFQAIQCERRQRMALGAAWLVFLLSLALPSVQVFNPVYGLWAAWYAYAIPIEAILRHEPPRLNWLVYLLINAANILMLLLPLVIWAQSRKFGQWLQTALCLTMPATWCLAWRMEGLLVGYFVWCASFAVALMAMRISRATFVTMVVVTCLEAPLVLGWNSH